MVAQFSSPCALWCFTTFFRLALFSKSPSALAAEGALFSFERYSMGTTISAKALVGLEDTRAFLGLSSGEDRDRDGLLIDLINAVTHEVDAYCGMSLKLATGTEFYDGDGLDNIVLRRRPIDLSVTPKVWIDSSRAFAASSLKVFWDRDSDADPTSTDYYIEKDEGALVLLSGVFPSAKSSVKVEYQAGYTVATAPDLVAGIKSEIKSWWQGIDRDHDVAAESGPGFSKTIRDQGLSAKTKRLLDPHSEMLA